MPTYGQRRPGLGKLEIRKSIFRWVSGPDRDLEKFSFFLSDQTESEIDSEQGSPAGTYHANSMAPAQG